MIVTDAGASISLCSNFDTLSMVTFINSSIERLARSAGVV
jgi:hypothetical protein